MNWDAIKLCAYTAALIAVLVGDYWDHALAPTIGGHILLFTTLIANVFRNPSPPAGQVSVTAPKAEVPKT
jgi:hypothetical protein